MASIPVDGLPSVNSLSAVACGASILCIIGSFKFLGTPQVRTRRKGHDWGLLI